MVAGTEERTDIMAVIFVLISFSLLVALIFLAFFIWSVRSGQYEDQYTPSVRILFDDKKEKPLKQNNKNNKE